VKNYKIYIEILKNYEKMLCLYYFKENFQIFRVNIKYIENYNNRK